jgi:hypothetical protein
VRSPPRPLGPPYRWRSRAALPAVCSPSFHCLHRAGRGHREDFLAPCRLRIVPSALHAREPNEAGHPGSLPSSVVRSSSVQEPSGVGPPVGQGPAPAARRRPHIATPPECERPAGPLNPAPPHLPGRSGGRPAGAGSGRPRGGGHARKIRAFWHSVICSARHRGVGDRSHTSREPSEGSFVASCFRAEYRP